MRALTEQVMEKIMIEWTHVYGHTGQHDNELADRAADLGAKGKVSDRAAPPQYSSKTTVNKWTYAENVG